MHLVGSNHSILSRMCVCTQVWKSHIHPYVSKKTYAKLIHLYLSISVSQISWSNLLVKSSEMDNYWPGQIILPCPPHTYACKQKTFISITSHSFVHPPVVRSNYPMLFYACMHTNQPLCEAHTFIPIISRSCVHPPVVGSKLSTVHRVCDPWYPPRTYTFPCTCMYVRKYVFL